jgi:hypothetical protein
MVRARMRCSIGIKSQCSRFEAVRGFQPYPRFCLHDGNAQVPAIRRRLGEQTQIGPLLPFLVGPGTERMRRERASRAQAFGNARRSFSHPVTCARV